MNTIWPFDDDSELAVDKPVEKGVDKTCQLSRIVRVASCYQYRTSSWILKPNSVLGLLLSCDNNKPHPNILPHNRRTMRLTKGLLHKVKDTLVERIARS